MQINYKINNEEHNIFFCKKKNFNKITSRIEKVDSDKNILLIYDENVNQNVVSEIIEELKSSGCNLFIAECKGNKSNKNEKFLFHILDLLIKFKFTKGQLLSLLGEGHRYVGALASSLYLRGLIYFCIPTTITSVIDSSIGGKTAINYKGVINAVGIIIILKQYLYLRM